MTKLEMVIRQVSDLRELYLKIQKEKSKAGSVGSSPRTRPGLRRRASSSG